MHHACEPPTASPLWLMRLWLMRPGSGGVMPPGYFGRDYRRGGVQASA
jgi:hypothetical protein